VATDTLDQWVYFLKNEEIKDDFQAKGLIEAKEKLNVLKLNEAERAAYENHQKELHHQASIYESTYVLGRMEEREKQQQQRQQEKINSAKMMLKSELSVQDVAKFSGLTEDEVKAL
jgi:predicted transposase/invertase (TIGR01784 family)